ncbi:MAG: beta-RFAP synthase [Planctomycetes bacterium]|nr:beta-RFAP synthase [Planctomycetota bacterium]
MIRVQAGSRLHFGLLSFPASPRWANHRGQETIPARRFGGVGLMVQKPGVQIAVRPSVSWSAEGPFAERILTFARQFVQTWAARTSAILPPHHLILEKSAPEHAGLGTGTQLGLAIGRALAAAGGCPDLDSVAIARLVGRGKRSALGIHGFARGGLLVDGGKKESEHPAPLVARADFPESWRLVLVLPSGGQGMHGTQEHQAFERLHRQGIAQARTDALCRLVVLALLPALLEQDLLAFGEALYEFNALAGEAFTSAQGGPYASPQIVELVAFLREQGVAGVGQSSWGPTVFAIAADQDQAEFLTRRIRDWSAPAPLEIVLTPAANQGARLELDAEPQE